jgi:hypothetical protein
VPSPAKIAAGNIDQATRVSVRENIDPAGGFAVVYSHPERLRVEGTIPP